MCVIRAQNGERWTDLTNKNWVGVVMRLGSFIGDIKGYMKKNMIWV